MEKLFSFKMQPEIWEITEQVFKEAVLLPPEQRTAFVKEKTTRDPLVRETVLRLLSNDSKGDFFLDEPIYHVSANLLAETDVESLLEREHFAHYRLLEVLGRGGMGVVILAKDERLGRKVALKLLPEFVKDPSLRSYFERESRIAAAISHPNIAYIYEAGEHETQPFIAMEYVEGETLRERLRREKKLSPAEAVRIAAQIASALDAAHEAGIIHRDIKPENIMLRPDGYAKVLDFGIAKLAAAADELTEKRGDAAGTENLTGHGLILGTTRYMSPEQLSGEAVDRQTDIWSLGAVLYEMIAGKPSFEADGKDKLAEAILEREPPPLSPDVSPDLSKILRRSLAKQKSERYSTAAEMYSDLRAARENAANAANASSPFHFLPHKKNLPATALLALLLLASAATIYFLSQNTSVPAEDSSTAAAPAPLNFARLDVDGRVLCAALSPDGGHIAYAAEKNGRQSISLLQIETGESREIVLPSPENDFEDACLAFSPGGDFIYYGVYESESMVGKLYRTAVEGGKPQFLLNGIDSPVSFSPDGARMVFLVTTAREEKLVVANADGSDLRTIVERIDPLFLSHDGHPAWSPDGRAIAFSEGTNAGQRQMHVAIYDVETGKARKLTDQHFFEVRQLGWLKDGSAVIFTALREGDTTNQFYQADYPSGRVTRRIEDLYDYANISLDRSRTKLVSIASENLAQIWTVEIGNQESARKISSGRNDGNGVAWLSNDMLVFGSEEGGNQDLWTMRADGGERRQLTDDPAADTQPAAASDGSFVIFRSTRGGVYHLWRLNPADGSLVQLTMGTGEHSPQISPDDRWMVFHRYGTSEPTSVWKIATDGGTPIQLTTRPSARADISPDGTLVASFYRENEEPKSSVGIYSIDGATGVKRLKLVAGARPFIPLRWSPDGKAVVYVVGKDGADNLWSHPLDGKTPPRPITSFTSDRIYSFDFAPDGKRVAIARGNRSSHIALVEGLR